MNTAEIEAKHPGYTKRWWIVAVVLAAEIVDLLDSTVVNVAGPTLRSSLGTSTTQLQWVIGGYTLALGSGLIVGGRLGDRLGRRFMFLFGIAGFTLAGTAWENVEALVHIPWNMPFAAVIAAIPTATHPRAQIRQ